VVLLPGADNEQNVLWGLLIAYTPHTDVEADSEAERWVESGRSLVPEAFRNPLLRDSSPPVFPGAVGIAVPGSPDAVFNDPNLLETDDQIADITTRVREIWLRHGVDALGWYQACHDYEDGFWGIYFHLPHIRDMARVMLERMTQENCRKGLKDVFRVVGLLAYEHEFFHARVDFLALGQELASRRPLALPYQERVYRNALAGPGPLEEALANFVGYRAVMELLAGWKAQRLWDEGAVRVATEFLEEQLDLSPTGYRDWRTGGDARSWRRLICQVLTGEPESVGEIPPLEGWLRRSSAPLLEKAAVPFAWWVVSPGEIDRLFNTPTRREVERFLRRRGWQPNTARG
jgi:hypothetical protein